MAISLSSTFFGSYVVDQILSVLLHFGFDI